MDLECETLGEVMVVTVCEDRIDAAVAIQFKDAIRNAARNAPARLVLDLRQVTFMDSSGLGAVIGAMKQIAPDHALELSALTPAVAKVFRLTRMNKIFTIHDSTAAALDVQANAG